MLNRQNYRLIILSGPSCVGKSPLSRALSRFHPEWYNSMQPLVLYNSRSPRPGETDGRDYYFRSREEIGSLKGKSQFVVMDVRGDLQALDLKNLKECLTNGNVFFEGNPFIGKVLLSHEALQDTNRLSIFMSPISKEEILFLKNRQPSGSLHNLITEIMRRKLLRRTRKQKAELSLKDLENIETRASSAYYELLEAHQFQFVLPNHDGEDSENWDAFYYPVGDAFKSLLTFVELLKGNDSPGSEKWDKNLLNGN